MDLNQLKFECPTSGMLLGTVVRALSLDGPSDHNDVTDPAAYLSSESNLGRNARRYFAGETIPEETRAGICRHVAKSVLKSGLLDDLQVPSAGPGSPTETEVLIADLITGWLRMWDTVFRRAAAGWPHPPQALGVFAVARQAVIDLALRTAALMHLCGASNPEGLVLFAPSARAGRDLLETLQSTSGCKYTRDELRTELKVPTKTIDGWIDDNAIPIEKHLDKLAKRFASPQRPWASLIRWLRLQYGAIAIGRRLREAMGDLLAESILGAFAHLLDLALVFEQAMRSPRPTLKKQQWDLLQSASPACHSKELITAFIKLIKDTPLPPDLWVDDLRAAMDGLVTERIEACFSIFGDWPELRAQLEADPQVVRMTDEKREEYAVSSALFWSSPWSLHRAVANCDGAGRIQAAEWLAIHALQFRRWTEVVVPLRQVVAAQPGDAKVHCMLGMALVKSPDSFGEGQEHLREAMRLRPDWDFAVAELARSHFDRKEHDRALAVLDDASNELVSRSNACMFLRALALKELQRYREALATADAAAKIDPQDAEAQSLAADLSFLLGDPEQARRYRKQALHLGHVTTRHKGVAFPNAVCPKRPVETIQPPADTSGDSIATHASRGARHESDKPRRSSDTDSKSSEG